MDEAKIIKTPVSEKISLSDAEDFSRPGFDGHVYVPSEAGAGFNTLLVDVHGRHPLKRMVDTTRTYFVVAGSGTFTLDGAASAVAVGDLFVVAPGSTYAYEGQMQLLEVNISPDNSFKDETLGRG
ncbi:MAG TPA: hypothetical protein VGO07_01830 [Candidatus Saccharimonadales bacterium]|jgi:mannose-6-phosphate isomerase-like protein (cupin superfamily)|nr:hypothetical protein [Candidatus Saccharimonadales bacterium]